MSTDKSVLQIKEISEAMPTSAEFTGPNGESQEYMKVSFQPLPDRINGKIIHSNEKPRSRNLFNIAPNSLGDPMFKDITEGTVKTGDYVYGSIHTQEIKPEIIQSDTGAYSFNGTNYNLITTATVVKFHYENLQTVFRNQGHVLADDPAPQSKHVRSENIPTEEMLREWGREDLITDESTSVEQETASEQSQVVNLVDEEESEEELQEQPF